MDIQCRDDNLVSRNRKSMIGILTRRHIIDAICSLVLCGIALVLYITEPMIVADVVAVRIEQNWLTTMLLFVFIVILLGRLTFQMLFQNQIKALRSAMDDIGMTDYEVYCEYKTADSYNNLLMSSNFTFIKKGLSITVVPNASIVWVFQRTTTNTTTVVSRSGVKMDEISRRKRYSLIIRTIKRKEYVVPFYREDFITNCIHDYGRIPYIIVGYDKEYNRLYKRHFAEFLDIQYNCHLPETVQKQ